MLYFEPYTSMSCLFSTFTPPLIHSFVSDCTPSATPHPLRHRPCRSLLHHRGQCPTEPTTSDILPGTSNSTLVQTCTIPYSQRFHFGIDWLTDSMNHSAELTDWLWQNDWLTDSLLPTDWLTDSTRLTKWLSDASWLTCCLMPRGSPRSEVGDPPRWLLGACV